MTLIRHIRSMLAALMLSLSVSATAYDTFYHVFFNINFENNTAEVTYGESDYSGEINIPKYIEYNGRVLTVTKIGNNAFRQCRKLTSVFIPNSVTHIGDSAFYKCTGMTEINIPYSVTVIGNHAFNGCTELKKARMSGSVKAIGYFAFGDCTKLENINLPKGIIEIGSYAFDNCVQLKEIDIPETITNISSHTFKGCSRLSEIKIPENVINIGMGAFEGCTALTEINIPEKVRNIESGTFRYCISLKRIDIPENVINIGIEAFEGCTALTEINIPKKVQYIGLSAFCSCTGLTEVVIPGNVIILDASAFKGCSGLTNLTIKNSDTPLATGGTAQWFPPFKDCPLQSLYIGRNCDSNIFKESMSSLEDMTFGDSITETSIDFTVCASLSDIYCTTPIPVAINDCTFSEEQYASVTLHIPEKATDAYKNAEYWNRFGTVKNDVITGIHKDTDSEQMKVTAWQGIIRIESAKGKITVYNTSGLLIKSIYAKNGLTEIEMPAKAVYIVRINGRTVKKVAM